MGVWFTIYYPLGLRENVRYKINRDVDDTSDCILNRYKNARVVIVVTTIATISSPMAMTMSGDVA